MALQLRFQEPHQEAARFLRDKPALAREVWDRLLPEVRGRAFTITGIEGIKVLERVRDEIASLPEGEVWDDVKGRVIEALEPYLGVGPAAVRRAELLLRTHGFQAFQTATWRAAQADEDTTHLQYLTMEDERVRDSHRALDGIILPKGDPFWETHMPPWDWGCRCRVRPMNPDLVEQARIEDMHLPPEQRRLIEGPALDQLRSGTRITPDGQRVDVTPPADRRGEPGAFRATPGTLGLSLSDLRRRYEGPEWETFEAWARQAEVRPGLTVWGWLGGRDSAVPPASGGPSPIRRAAMERARQAGLADEQIAVLAALPPQYDRFLETVKIEVGSKAKYSPTTKTITIDGNAKAWNGHPSTLLHELGHHIGFETGANLHLGASKSFAAALEADRVVVLRWLKEHVGADWRKVFSAIRGNYEAMCAAIGVENVSTRPIEVKKDCIRILDAIMGVTEGRYGTGHSPKYMRIPGRGAAEVFAHAAAVVEGPKTSLAKLFLELFPKSVEEYKKVVGL